MAQYSVDIVAKALGGSEVDKLANSVKNVETAAGGAQKGFLSAGNSIKAFGLGAKGAAGGVKVLGGAVQAALGPIGAALAAVGGLTAAFKTIAAQDFAEAKIKSLGVNSDELVGKLNQVSSELQGQVSVAELTGAAYDVASAGFTDAADAAQVLKAAAAGAVGGFTDLNTAGDALTSVLNAYGLAASEANGVIDQFIQTQNDGKIVVAEYAANIGKVAAAAAGLGVPLGEVNAAIAQATASGVQAEVAFTGVKAALARLASGEAAKAIEDTGLKIDAASVASDGFIGTLQKLKDAGLDTGQIFKALGTEAAPAILPLLNNLEKTNQLLKNQENSAGAAAKALTLASGTIEGAWKKVTTAISNFFTQQSALGDVIRLAIEGIAFVLDDLIKKINFVLQPFQLLLNVITTIVTAATQLRDAFASAFEKSEGARALQLIFEKIQGVIGGIAAVVGGQLQQAFQGVLVVVGRIAEFLGGAIYQGLNALISGAAQVLKFIPGLQQAGASLAKGWENLKKEVEKASDGAKKLAENAGEVAAELKPAAEIAAEVKQQIEEGAKAIDTSLKLTQARVAAEKAVNDVMLQQAERQLKAAQSQEERVKAAKAIYNLTVQQAEVELQATKAAIAAELDKARLAFEAAKVKEREVAAVVQLAVAQGNATQAYFAALQAQRQAVGLAEQQLQTATELASEQNRAADAVFRGKVAAAQAALEQNRVADAATRTNSAVSATADKQQQVAENTNTAANEAGRFANNMERAAEAADKTQKAMSSLGDGGGGGGGFSFSFGAAGKNAVFVKEWNDALRKLTQQTNTVAGAQRAYNELLSRYLKKAEVYNKAIAAERLDSAKENYAKYTSGRVAGYASGGYVTSPQLAMVGEGGEPEYVIPRSKMAAAMANFASGKRGEAILSGTPQVNVTTGPVMQMNGAEYVTKADLVNSTQSAVSQTLNLLRSDPAVRRSVGVAR